jgi:hypothetical protein
MFQNWTKVDLVKKSETHLTSNDVEEIVLPSVSNHDKNSNKTGPLNPNINGVAGTSTAVERKILKRDTLKKVFNKWLDVTSIDAFSKIFVYNSKPIKLVWTCLFLILACLTGYLVVQNLLNYYHYEVVTQVNVVSVRPIEFPTVTLCNLNPFTSKYAENLVQYVSLVNYGQDLTSLNVSYEQAMYFLPNITELTKMYVAQSNYTLDERKLLGNSIESFLSAKFSGERLTLKNLNYYYSYDYGLCLQFNSDVLNETKNSFREGKDFGLSFSFPRFSSDNLYPTAISDGLVVFIHEKSYEPKSSDGVAVSFFSETNLPITKTITHHFPSPYSQCQDLASFSSEFYDFLVKSLKKAYRQYDCFNLCRQKIIIEKCGCYYPKYPRLDNHTSSCLNQTQWECISDPKNDLDTNSQKECTLKCPIQCESITYSLQLSSAWFPTESISSLWYNKTCQNKNFTILSECYANWNDNDYATYPNLSLALNVFYPYLEYTEISETPKTSWFDLVSQVGGSLGVFLGLSVFHFLEVFEIIFLIFYVLLKK